VLVVNIGRVWKQCVMSDFTPGLCLQRRRWALMRQWSSGLRSRTSTAEMDCQRQPPALLRLGYPRQICTPRTNVFQTGWRRQSLGLEVCHLARPNYLHSGVSVYIALISLRDKPAWAVYGFLYYFLVFTLRTDAALLPL
jgi:hypothetical protein